MKKITKLMAGIFAVSMFFACNGEDDNGSVEPVEVVPPAEANGGSKTNVPDRDPNEDIPEDSIHNYKEDNSALSIYNVQDLADLVELVNGDSITFKGKTITLKNDIVINDNLLGEDFTEPKEISAGRFDTRYVVLDSIGKKRGNDELDDVDADTKEVAFEGTFDGCGHTITGFYAYQGHQGLGFIGNAGNGAVLKNLILKDACIVNYNIWTDKLGKQPDRPHDGYDDDRFGGLIGMVTGKTRVENCFFSGVLGSQAAQDRGKPYEYIGGLCGRIDGALTAKNVLVYAKIYAEESVSGPINNKIGSGGSLKKFGAVEGTLITEDNVESLTDKIDADAEKMAGWITNGAPVVTVNVTFDADNGEAPVVVPVAEEALVEQPADPVKDGFTFGGWYNGTAAYNFTSPVTAALTLKAKWNAVTYAVTIAETENGTVAAVPATAAGAEVTLTITPADNYELDTVTVTGATVGAVTVTENKFTMPAEAVTVTVTFKEKVVVPPTPTMYSVTFDADNGTTPAVVEVEENTAVAAPAVNPEKDGFTFLGWFAPEAAVAYDFATLVTANLTLTAHWEEVPNQGTEPGNDPSDPGNEGGEGSGESGNGDGN